MSTFSKALEQAQHERTVRGAAATGPSTGVPSSIRPDEPPTPVRDRTVPPAAPVAAETPDGVDAHLVSLLYPASFLAESYRVLRHRVEHLRRTTERSVLAVSSAGVGEGKTTTAINLAGALAQAPGSRVLIVDADLRKSSIPRLLALGETGSRGLVGAILDPTVGLDDVVVPVPPFNLHVVPAGACSAAPYEILKSPRLGELLDDAGRRYDYVIVDTAPLVPVPDSRLIGKWVDAFVLVVAADKTSSKLLAEALNLMEPDKLLGLVFNGNDEAMSGYDHYSAYEYSAYGAPANGAGRSWYGRLWHRSRPGKRRTSRRPDTSTSDGILP